MGILLQKTLNFIFIIYLIFLKLMEFLKFLLFYQFHLKLKILHFKHLKDSYL